MLQRGSSQPSEYLLSWLRSSGHRGRRSSAAPSWLKQRHINVGKQLLYFIHQLEMFNISSIYLYRNVARRLVTVNAPVLRVDLITCFGYRICQDSTPLVSNSEAESTRDDDRKSAYFSRWKYLISRQESESSSDAHNSYTPARPLSRACYDPRVSFNCAIRGIKLPTSTMKSRQPNMPVLL